MARYPVAFGSIPNAPITPIVDTQGRAMGIILQNPSTVDVYVSEDPTRLQTVPASNVPQVGLHFPPDPSPAAEPLTIVLPRFNGKLYARAAAAGASMEAIAYELCDGSVKSS